jgi:hypothetical protein
VLGALGLKLIVVVDEEQTAKMHGSRPIAGPRSGAPPR